MDSLADHPSPASAAGPGPRGIDGLNDQLLGPTGLVSTEEDATLPARLLAEFAKDAQGKPKMKAGLIDGRLFGEAELEVLAKLPGREALLGQVVTAIASPMSGIVFTLNALLAKFVRTLSAVADQRREAGDDAPAPAAEETADDPTAAAAETGPGASPEAPPEEADAPPAGDAESKPGETPEASSDDKSGEASPSENA